MNCFLQDENLFVSGCLDNKIRLWNIIEKSIILSVLSSCGYVTSIAFSFDGALIFTGSYDGRCVIYESETFKLSTIKHIQSRSYKRFGKKITGMEMSPDNKHVLISTNDSSVHEFSIEDFTATTVYKDLKNENFQIFASYSEYGSYIISGSEDYHVYVWNTSTEIPRKIIGVKKSRSHDSFQAHPNVVTCAIFAPFSRRETKLFSEGQIIVTADASGEMKVFENKNFNDNLTKNTSIS